MKSFLKRIAAWIVRILFRIAFSLKLFPFGRGVDRGGSIMRYYVNAHIKKHKSLIAGRVLEFGKRDYQSLACPETLRSYDVLDLQETSISTIIGDIQDCPQIAAGSFDTILFTQVLEHVYDIRKVISELNRILAPGGTLIMTVPFYAPIHEAPEDFWRFTPKAFERLVKESSFDETEFETHGNVYSSIMYQLGLGLADTTAPMLEAESQRDPIMIGCVAKKNAAIF